MGPRMTEHIQTYLFLPQCSCLLLYGSCPGDKEILTALAEAQHTDIEACTIKAYTLDTLTET